MPIPATVTVLGHTVKTKYVAGAALVGLGYYLFFTNSGKAFVASTGLNQRHGGGSAVGAAALPAQFQ